MPAPRMNTAPPDFDPERDLPPGFLAFYTPLHQELAPRREALVAARRVALTDSLAGQKPTHLPPSDGTSSAWQIDLPAWCQDQRNQMTGPADDADLVVKMLNSGSPGVMLDLEDSMANTWPHLMAGVRNILRALDGSLTYEDRKRGRQVGIEPSSTVIWNRVRGLHLGQAGVMPGGAPTSGSLFDLALLAFQVDPEKLRHPLAIYIPKSESAAEAGWWRDATIRCMALIESHPLAYQMEEFLYALREHILGLNLGRWDYMASLIHYNLADPDWVLPDRNTIPHDIPFFQRLRLLMADICHRRGALAIGGMTALYPSREDVALNARALEALAADKQNEARCYMDGAWTGHPDQNAIAVAQFPDPNQIRRRPPDLERYPDLRPVPRGVGHCSETGTQAAARTVIRYRNGVLNGRGASLLDGYMEDLATDRIYRLMLAQRLRHGMPTVNGGGRRPFSAGELSQVFDAELGRLLSQVGTGRDLGGETTLREARQVSEELIQHAWFDPV
jgi:malate synthase